MRLKRISKNSYNNTSSIFIEFVSNGVYGNLTFPVPDNFDVMTRAEKVAWSKRQIADYLNTYILAASNETFFPDNMSQETAANDFDNLPGWGTWTAGEAESWIDTNVTTLAMAKIALKAMAKAIVYLRNVTMEH